MAVGEGASHPHSFPQFGCPGGVVQRRPHRPRAARRRPSPSPAPSVLHSRPRPGASVAPPGRGRGPGAHLAVAGRGGGTGRGRALQGHQGHGCAAAPRHRRSLGLEPPPPPPGPGPGRSRSRARAAWRSRARPAPPLRRPPPPAPASRAGARSAWSAEEERGPGRSAGRRACAAREPQQRWRLWPAGHVPRAPNTCTPRPRARPSVTGTRLRATAGTSAPQRPTRCAGGETEARWPRSQDGLGGGWRGSRTRR